MCLRWMQELSGARQEHLQACVQRRVVGGREHESGSQAAVQTIIAQNRMASLAKHAKEGSAQGRATYTSSPEEVEHMTEPAR